MTESETGRVDQAEQVRQGEALPIPQLESYLLDHLPQAHGPLSVEQFPRGYSNLTYLLRLGAQELVLRRPPFGVAIASAHDMGREYRVLSGLAQVYDRVPRPLLFCEDDSIIGAPFYVMERIRGVVLRAERMAELKPGRAEMERLALATVDNLVAIHSLDPVAAGLADLGRPNGYVERQISGWVRRYRAAQSHEWRELEAILTWLEANRPTTPTPTAIIHNDYKYDNLILDPDDLGNILAVLDWEMCTLGDPFMDLGTTLGYWTQPDDPAPLVGMFGLTTLPGNLTRQAVIRRYEEMSGHAVPNPLFYYVYGIFKIGVILQQIYNRYRQGHSQDERFAGLYAVVEACGVAGASALHADRV
jgi:aminoglycoside phosphotransferase (APT) family kinase protein